MSLFQHINFGGLDRPRYWFVMDYARKHFKEGHKLLEVGSDDGAFAVGFSLVGYDVTALDPETTPYLASLYTFKRMTLDDWAKQEDRLLKRYGPGPHDKLFEMIHLGEVLEHCDKPGKMMKQACAVCTGRLMVSVPSYPWKGHLRTYTKDQAVEFLDKHMTLDEVHEITHPKLQGSQTLVMGVPK